MSAAPKVRTCLWFEKNGLEAARFYVSLLPDSRLEKDYAAGADRLRLRAAPESAGDGAVRSADAEENPARN